MYIRTHIFFIRQSNGLSCKMRHESTILLTDYWLLINNLYPTEINISSRLVILLLRLSRRLLSFGLKKSGPFLASLLPEFCSSLYEFLRCLYIFQHASLLLPNTFFAPRFDSSSATWVGWFSGDVKERRVDNVLIMTRSRGGSCKDIPVPGSRWWYPICRSFLSLFATLPSTRVISIVRSSLMRLHQPSPHANWRYIVIALDFIFARWRKEGNLNFYIHIFGTG